MFEIATRSRWYIPSKAKYPYETDSEQVPRGKVEKNSAERVKKTVKLPYVTSEWSLVSVSVAKSINVNTFT